MAEASGTDPIRYSLFSSDTLEELRAAMQEAELAVRAGDERDCEALAVCQRVALGVVESDAGRTDVARGLLDEALAGTRDARLLFLGFQFHFRLNEYDRAEHFVRRRLEVVGPDTAEAA